jgi:hypothetical protein
VSIPRELLPHPAQVPPDIKADADRLQRFELCFAIGRMICQRDDPAFVRQLFASDVPTGDLEQTPAASAGDQLAIDF